MSLNEFQPSMGTTAADFKPHEGDAVSSNPTSRRGPDNYARHCLENELGRLVATPNGRKDTLNKASRRLGRFVGADRLNRAEVEEGLLSACRSNGYIAKNGEEDAKHTIQSGLDSGVAEPNCKGLLAPSALGAALIRGHKATSTLDLGEIPPPAIRNERGTLEYEAGQLVELLRPGWTCAALSSHAAYAERILDYLGDILRFSSALGWLGYNGRHWDCDDRHATQTADKVKILAQTIREEGATLYEVAGELAKQGRGTDAEAMSRAASQHIKHAKQVETKNFIEGALHFAAGSSHIRVEPEAFDQRPWLIGFENGVWDKGEWREHRREDFLLHLCPVTYDFDADRREWEDLLERMTGGSAAFARTLQDVAGYILSGASHLRLLPWLYGPKGTGKSTFAELLQTILGKMGHSIDPKKMQDDTSRGRLGADLWNRRLALCSEAGNVRIPAELLKTLSGSDRLTVEFKYKEAFDALPRHVLLMVANDAPRLDAYDEALKDRVLALPFTHPLDEGEPLVFEGHARIEAARKDPNSMLVQGFVAWAIDGLKRVYKTQTISRADCIEEATAKFWADTDPLTPFWEAIEEEVDLKVGIPSGELRQKYEKWCENEGVRPLKGKAWGKACESKKLEQVKRGPSTNRVRYWVLQESGRDGRVQMVFSETLQDTLDPHIRFPEKGIERVHRVHNSEGGAQ